jgi:hypothetical protein
LLASRESRERLAGMAMVVPNTILVEVVDKEYGFPLGFLGPYL